MLAQTCFYQRASRWLSLGMLFVATVFSACGSTAQKNIPAKPDTSFFVTSFAPDGEIPARVQFPSIQIQFSEPVIALQKLGEPLETYPGVTIVPPLKGVFRWYGTGLLSFDCEEKLIPQKLYTVHIDKNFTSIHGTRISGTREYVFHTEELRLTSIEPGYIARREKNISLNTDDIPPEYAQDIALTFSNTVNAAVVKNYISVTAAQHKQSYRFSTRQIDRQTILLTVIDTLPRNAEITITLAKGAMPDKSCYETTKEQTHRFHTLRPCTLESVSGRSELYITFNHRIAPGLELALLEAFSFSPAMEITHENIAISGRTITVTQLPVTYGAEYSFTLAAHTVKDVYGQSYDLPISQTISVPNADSFASFKQSGFVILESQFTPCTAFEYQNILKSGSYTITPLAGVSAVYTPPKPYSVSIPVHKEENNTRIIQTVDLSPALERTNGGFRGAVQFTSTIPYSLRDSRPQTAEHESFIQVTDLGVTVRRAYNKTAIFVTSLTTGTPVADAAVSLITPDAANTEQRTQLAAVLSGQVNRHVQTTTDKDGLAIIDREAPDSDESWAWLEVATSDDRVVCSITAFHTTTHRVSSIPAVTTGTAIPQRAVTFLFTDRGLYQPGETVSIKAVDRTLTAGIYSDYIGPYTMKFTDSTWQRHRTVYATANGTTSDKGTASATWTIPPDIKPGVYYIEYSRDDGSLAKEGCAVTIQYFERLRFEATVAIPPVVYFRGDTVSAEIAAQYFGGGSLAGGNVTVDWLRERITFAPPGNTYADMTFGTNQWNRWNNDVEPYFHESETTGLSDAGTAHSSVVTGNESKAGNAYRYSLEAQVTDSGNQMIAVRAQTIVHPASFYIGIRLLKSTGFAQKNKPLQFGYTLATPEGTFPLPADMPRTATITYELSRESWESVPYEDGYGFIQYTRQPTKIVEKTGTVPFPQSPESNEQFTVTPIESGSYTLTLTAQDARGRTVITERDFYVSSTDWINPRFGDSVKEISLTPDKERYATGDTAQLLLTSTLPRGSYLVTIEREGLFAEQVYTLDAPSTVIDVPIKDSYIPFVYVTVTAAANRDGPPAENYDSRDEHKPQAIIATATLTVEPTPRSFDIAISTDKDSYRPGSPATITVHAAKDAKPIIGAEITLLVVDRGVTDLIDYHVTNPLDYFYAPNKFRWGIASADSRAALIDPVTYGSYRTGAREMHEIRTMNRMATVADSMSAEFAAVPVNAAAASPENGGLPYVRKDFRPTALFASSLITDSTGTASASFTVPDSLTEYVITVIGVNGNTFAHAEETLAVTQAISVRDVEPRILRTGDAGETGVVITNNSDATTDITVSFAVLRGLEKTGYTPQAGDLIRTAGSAAVQNQPQKHIRIEPGKTDTVMFTVKAHTPGWITLAFTVQADGINEIIYKPLEIEKPFVYETVTTVGEIATTETICTEYISISAKTDSDVGNIRIQLDATRLGTVASAVEYVFRYPYGCLEQRAARIMPLIAFGDYITVFGLESEVRDTQAVVEKELTDWAQLQKTDGGFPYWSDGTESSFSVSLRIAEILALAKQKNVAIPTALNIQKLIDYIESEFKKASDNTLWYPRAYAAYVLARLGRPVSVAALTDIITHPDGGISEYAFAGLASLASGNRPLTERAIQRIKNCMTLTPRGASFQIDPATRYWYFYNSTAERYALALHLLTEWDATDTYISHLVYELLQMQKSGRGYWQSTATTSRVLIALDAYIRQYRLTETDFSAQASLNGAVLAHGIFAGANASPVHTSHAFTAEELADIPRDTIVPLVLSKNGTGTLFYTASLAYALPAEEQTARDEGISIYNEIVDARTGEKITGGTLKSGTIYRHKIYVSTPKERTFVALRVPVPAGAAILNAAFSTTATIPASPEETAILPYRRWSPAHQDIYNAELQCFWDYLPHGMHTIEFLFRAQRTGTYAAPSTYAECMYEPEIFGRTAGTVWTIEY